jgi:hypothetical protein
LRDPRFQHLVGGPRLPEAPRARAW